MQSLVNNKPSISENMFYYDATKVLHALQSTESPWTLYIREKVQRWYYLHENIKEMCFNAEKYI